MSFRPRVKHGVTLLDAESKVWIPACAGMTRKNMWITMEIKGIAGKRMTIRIVRRQEKTRVAIEIKGMTKRNILLRMTKAYFLFSIQVLYICTFYHPLLFALFSNV